jgi:hypothetical protein
MCLVQESAFYLFCAEADKPGCLLIMHYHNLFKSLKGDIGNIKKEEEISILFIVSVKFSLITIPIS